MFGYKTEQEIHAQCKLNVRRILKTPQNVEKNLYKIMSNKNVRSDFILESTTATEKLHLQNIFQMKIRKASFLKVKVKVCRYKVA